MEEKLMMSEEYQPGAFYMPNLSICIPCPEHAEFEPTPAVFALVTQDQFSGEEDENPFLHIDGFEWLIDSLKKKGSPRDWVCGSLFPYSLKGKARQWLDKQPMGSFQTWEKVRSAFINHFYTKDMTDRKRSQLHGFKQAEDETFREAWIRYEELIRSCPHHEFPQAQLVVNFYRGLSWEFQGALDAINGGNFMEQFPEDGLNMIRRFSRSLSANHCQHSESKLTNTDAQLLLDVKEMLKEVLRREEFKEYLSEERSTKRRLHGECYAIRQRSKVRFPKRKSRKERDAILYEVCSELGDKVENLVMEMSLNIDALTDRFFQLQERIKAIEEKLNIEKDEVMELHEPSPSEEEESRMERSIEMEDSHKECCMARSKITTWARFNPSKRSEKHKEVADNGRPDFYKEDMLATLATQQALRDRVDRHLQSVGRLPELKAEIFPDSRLKQPISRGRRVTRTKEQVELEEYLQPTLPFFNYHDFCDRLPDPREPISDEEFNYKLGNAVRELLELYPFLKPLGMESKLREFMQDMFTRRRSVHYGLIIFSELCDEQMLHKAEFKKPDPGIFTIECYIGRTHFKKAMCDLGSSVSLIPQYLAEALGFEKYMDENDITIYLADRSNCEPEGRVTNVPVQIGDHFIPTDFYVIRYTVEKEYPILFGRPFLAAAGAVIDTKEKKVVLNFETESIELRMDQPGILFTSDKKVHHVNELNTKNNPPLKKQKKTFHPPNPNPEDATP